MNIMNLIIIVKCYINILREVIINNIINRYKDGSECENGNDGSRWSFRSIWPQHEYLHCLTWTHGYNVLQTTRPENDHCERRLAPQIAFFRKTLHFQCIDQTHLD